jgi:hypothetical protein
MSYDADLLQHLIPGIRFDLDPGFFIPGDHEEWLESFIESTGIFLGTDPWVRRVKTSIFDPPICFGYHSFRGVRPPGPAGAAFSPKAHIASPQCGQTFRFAAATFARSAFARVEWYLNRQGSEKNRWPRRDGVKIFPHPQAQSCSGKFSFLVTLKYLLEKRLHASVGGLRLIP